MSQTPAIGWYGKVPSAGDFLKRRFPEALFNPWSNWFQLGLLEWQQRPDSGRQFASAPVWNFVVPPLLGSRLVQMGCLLPACDSVGRQYPLCALLSYPLSAWSAQRLARAGEWYQQLGRTLLLGVRHGDAAEQLDRALLAIPAPPEPETSAASGTLAAIGYHQQQDTLGWRRAAECFTAQQYTSFWWTNRTDGYPLYTHLHSGNFTSQLFTMLFDPAAGAKPGRNGLYPPMFE